MTYITYLSMLYSLLLPSAAYGTLKLRMIRTCRPSQTRDKKTENIEQVREGTQTHAASLL